MYTGRPAKVSKSSPHRNSKIGSHKTQKLARGPARPRSRGVDEKIDDDEKVDEKIFK
jgi:hypothetical protein